MRIPDKVLDCVVYLYASKQDAREGQGIGGSGFIVYRSSVFRNVGFHHYYVVTNNHVIGLAKSHPVIRFNTKDGFTEILETDASDWFPHPYGDDLAVHPVNINMSTHHFSAIGVEMFVEEGKLDDWIGPGTETMMIGRFIGHDGRQRNKPALRYGNIAMMPDGIDSNAGVQQLSYLVEQRSIPGYSGSPVFAPLFPFKLSDAQGTPWVPFVPGRQPTPRRWLWFLGVDWCHLSRYSRVLDAQHKALDDKTCVELNTGMAGVIPAWRLRQLIDSEELVKLREKQDADSFENQPQTGVVLDSATGEDDGVFTREDFESALKKASRKTTSKG